VASGAKGFDKRIDEKLERGAFMLRGFDSVAVGLKGEYKVLERENEANRWREIGWYSTGGGCEAGEWSGEEGWS
jgi:hypothetical protein